MPPRTRLHMSRDVRLGLTGRPSYADRCGQSDAVSDSRLQAGTDGIGVAGLSPSAWALANTTALCFDNNGHFSLVATGRPDDPPRYIVQGQPAPTTLAVEIEVTQTAAGVVTVRLNGSIAVSAAALPAAEVGGGIAVHATAGVALRVEQLAIVDLAATPAPQRWFWLTPADGIAGSASARFVGWTASADPSFRRGAGFESDGGNASLVKFNFVGVAARLWLPRGPRFGQVVVSVDGGPPTVVNLNATAPTPSAPVYEWRETTAAGGRRARWPDQVHTHALLVRWRRGGMPCDGLEYLPVSA